MKNLVLYTPNFHKFEPAIAEGLQPSLIPNIRFGHYYLGEYHNYDRLCIIGVPNEEDNTLSIGISFCAYPENFSKAQGKMVATMRAESYLGKYKPYAVVDFEELTQGACLDYMYKLHEELVKKTVKEVKKLVAAQIVK